MTENKARALRIVHLDTERSWRGGERQTFWLARELQQRGHENWMACRPGFPLAEACRSAQLPVFGISPWSEMDPWTVFRLRRFLRSRRIHILHAHTAHAVGLGAWAVKNTGVRLLATRRVDFPLQRNLLSRWKYAQVDGLVAVAHKVKEALAAGGIPSKKITVIPSSINAAEYPSPADRARFRREKGYSEKDSLVVNTAALTPQKDHRTLLRAAQRVCQKHPSAKFLILGDGPLKPSLQRQARELKIADHIQFLGHQPNVLEYVVMADLCVLSSVGEGFPTSLLDAMALGVPTVATWVGGVPEMYGSINAPELVPPQDPEALARNLLWVLEDPRESEGRVARGKQTAGRFTVAAMAEQYERVYSDLLHEQP